MRRVCVRVRGGRGGRGEGAVEFEEGTGDGGKGEWVFKKSGVKSGTMRLLGVVSETLSALLVSEEGNKKMMVPLTDCKKES